MVHKAAVLPAAMVKGEPDEPQKARKALVVLTDWNRGIRAKVDLTCNTPAISKWCPLIQAAQSLAAQVRAVDAPAAPPGNKVEHLV